MVEGSAVMWTMMEDFVGQRDQPGTQARPSLKH
jgi:hypothetical protein